MKFSALATLAAAVLGAIGTVLLFFGTYGLGPYGVAFWGGRDTIKQLESTTRRIWRRATVQRIELSLLLASFIVEGTSAFLPGP